MIDVKCIKTSSLSRKMQPTLQGRQRNENYRGQSGKDVERHERHESDGKTERKTVLKVSVQIKTFFPRNCALGLALTEVEG